MLDIKVTVKIEAPAHTNTDIGIYFAIEVGSSVTNRDLMKLYEIIEPAIGSGIKSFLDSKKAEPPPVESTPPSPQPVIIEGRPATVDQVTNLNKSIDELELTVRAYNGLVGMNIRFIGQLVQRSKAELLKKKNYGLKSWNCTKEAVFDLTGLTLGTKGVKLENWTCPD